MKSDLNSNQAKISLIVIAVFFTLSFLALRQYQSRFKVEQKIPNNSQFINSSNVSTITSPSTFFYPKIFLDRDQTFVTIPFDFSQQKPNYPIWLYLKSQDNQSNIERLAYHPQLFDLDWPVLSTDNLSLYQKESVYESIDEFLSSPPTDSNILVDPNIKRESFANINNVSSISDTIDTNATDFILTTFRPMNTLDNSTYHYDTIIDATKAFVNDSEELVFQLKGSQVSEENPYTIGQIHVDYRLK